jgi:hypothetical protein
MRRTTFLTVTLVTVFVLATTGTVVHAGQQQLRLGSIVEGSVGSSAPSVFTFTAETPGVLTVVVRGKDDADLQIVVTDVVGQELPGGRFDTDLQGNVGAEQGATVIGAAGEYQVQIHTWGGGGRFDIAASWLAFPALGGPADPDGMPTAAAALVPGTPVDDSINPAGGDPWDWFMVTADSAGVITVITEAPAGDLVLEVFNDGAFGEAVNRSDQDMQGVVGNESLTIQAAAGQTFYFKVSPAFDSGEAIPYRIRAGIM